MPPRLVIESHDSCVWDLAWKQVFVFQPVNINLFPIWFACYFPRSCPVWVSAKAVNCDYTTGLMFQFNISNTNLAFQNTQALRLTPPKEPPFPTANLTALPLLGTLSGQIFLCVRIEFSEENSKKSKYIAKRITCKEIVLFWLGPSDVND